MLGELYGEDFKSEKIYHINKDVFYCIILHNEELYNGGETEKLNHDSVYLGYYIDEEKIVDLINIVTTTPSPWILQ